MHWATFGHVAWQLLGWPAGIILGNLLASVVWSSIFEWRLGVHRKKTENAVDEKLASQNQDVSQILSDHHDKIKEIINVQQETFEPGSV